MISFRLFLVTVLVFAGLAGNAKAEIFRWQDPKTGVSLNFPDRWARVHNQQPDTMITIAAPSHDDQATCKMRAREDRRFLVYPREYAANIQKLNFSTKFWEDYLGEYDDYVIESVQDNAALGRGFGSYAEASYTALTGTKSRMKALMFVANYGGETYIFECAAVQEVFGRWYPGFTNILRSVDFKKHDHELPMGNYRNFMADPLLRIHGAQPQDLYVF